jgi:hypothetical protein
MTTLAIDAFAVHNTERILLVVAAANKQTSNKSNDTATTGTVRSV